VPGAIVALAHLGIDGLAAKLPSRTTGASLVREHRIELDGVDLREVETASFHLAKDTAADVIVLAAHETSS
jgi:hypothetical protein